MLNPEDVKHLESKEITEETVNAQVERFRQGFDPLVLAAPATTGEGIIKLSHTDIDQLVKSYSDADLDVIKFVPASGAASRMFKSLFALMELEEESYLEDKMTSQFFDQIKDFAFYDDLKEVYEKRYNEDFNTAITSKDKKIISSLLQDDGLAYGSLPKGLLRFHRYEDDVRTPVFEHISEGLAYAEKKGVVKIHFTVSPDHQEKFESHVKDLLSVIDAEIHITYSTQKSSTDTIAVDLENEPFRDNDNNLLFRPAGHGALLENLNQLTADVVFIKNIDNVVPDRIKKETIRFKKALAGVLLDYQSRSFKLLEASARGESVKEEGSKLLKEMGLVGDFSEKEVVNKLNRPIRVCGMVKNEGEPGGGPFWVNNNGYQTLQIVESAQVDISHPDQESIFRNATHFNPVDLVCGLKNYKGETFDLINYRDDDTGFITEKSFQGRKLKAMELPGLWNGAMADWNTIFVEVPLITFNPVKNVMDLLKENHQ